MLKRILVLAMITGFLMVSFAWADEDIVKKAEEIKASAIIPTKLKGLEWKLKYYQEKSLTFQLQAILEVWNRAEFQELQKIIRQTDQEIKQLLAPK